MRLLVHRLHPDAKLPFSAHPDQDLGYDLHALEDVYLEPFEQTIVRTGIAARFVAAGYVVGDPAHNNALQKFGLEIEDRSGVAARHGVHTLAGKIDYGWTGEIGVVMILLGPPKHVRPGDEGKLQGLRQMLGWTTDQIEDTSHGTLHLLRVNGVRVGYQIRAGDRIAQMLPRPIYTDSPVIELPDNIPEEGARGANGYGSTGR